MPCSLTDTAQSSEKSYRSIVPHRLPLTKTGKSNFVRDQFPSTDIKALSRRSKTVERFAVSIDKLLEKYIGFGTIELFYRVER